MIVDSIHWGQKYLGQNILPLFFRYNPHGVIKSAKYFSAGIQITIQLRDKVADIIVETANNAICYRSQLAKTTVM